MTFVHPAVAAPVAAFPSVYASGGMNYVSTVPPSSGSIFSTANAPVGTSWPVRRGAGVTSSTLQAFPTPAPMHSDPATLLAPRPVPMASGSVAASATHKAAAGEQVGVAAGEPAAGETVCGAAPGLEDVRRQLPSGYRFLCVLGGTSFKNPASEPLVQQVAEELRARSVQTQGIVILTGGMKGVQETFAKAVGDALLMFQLCPVGTDSEFGVGVDVVAGADLPERMEIFGQLGDVYISFEGGPGVAKEAKSAFERGAFVLPMISTGGASGGKFEFPAGALEKPSWASDTQWDAIKDGTDEAAVAAVEIIVQRLGL